MGTRAISPNTEESLLGTSTSVTESGQPAGVVTHERQTEQLIKSRKRVKEHGEVFTPRRMVEQMLDLVRPELETGPQFVDKTFFEPSAGDGNFLIAILRRKLKAIERRYQPEFWPTESLFAVASIYGIELLEDNLSAAKEGLLAEFTDFHKRNGVRCNYRTNLYRAAEYLLSANILHGNTLTGLDASGELIEFSWWNRVLNLPGLVQREPFTLASIRGASTGAFDFEIYAVYKRCKIDQVHKEVSADD
mgnify:CR=1 FL=1|tara:strand:+ start:1240 stop:1983 length:744 start_codon:yes stop_codon:yes gene_type:complete